MLNIKLTFFTYFLSQSEVSSRNFIKLIYGSIWNLSSVCCHWTVPQICCPIHVLPIHLVNSRYITETDLIMKYWLCLEEAETYRDPFLFLGLFFRIRSFVTLPLFTQLVLNLRVKCHLKLVSIPQTFWSMIGESGALFV